MRTHRTQSHTQPIISVRELVKEFSGHVRAIQGISFEVKEGEFFAFLGPNGAGKSTTIQVLTTLLMPTFGEVRIAGFDSVLEPERVRREIGVALQETGIDPVLTGRELLVLQARLFGFSSKEAKSRAMELLERINLTADADRRIGKYSGGMRRRLDLALSLVHRPRILFLDEPTTGLDPYNRMAIWEEIRTLHREYGTTIFLTTQYLEEADQLSERVCILNKGAIVADGTAAQLKQRIGRDVIELHFSHPEAAVQAQQHLYTFIQGIHTTDAHLTGYVQDGAHALPEIVRTLDREGFPPIRLQLAPPTLDDVFLQVTGETLDTGNIKDKEKGI